MYRIIVLQIDHIDSFQTVYPAWLIIILLYYSAYKLLFLLFITLLFIRGLPIAIKRILMRCNPWPHVANCHISISQLLLSCCYLFTVSNSGLLSVQLPRPASHAHFRHRHIPELICEINRCYVMVTFLTRGVEWLLSAPCWRTLQGQSCIHIGHDHVALWWPGTHSSREYTDHPRWAIDRDISSTILSTLWSTQPMSINVVTHNVELLPKNWS